MRSPPKVAICIVCALSASKVAPKGPRDDFIVSRTSLALFTSGDNIMLALEYGVSGVIGSILKVGK